jgi:ribonucleoside-diphosphate reductase beta chain
VNVVRSQEPDLWDAPLEQEIVQMLQEAVDAETQFAEDLLSGGVAGLSVRDMRQYLGYVADSRLQRLGIAPAFHAKNPFSFMDLQDVQELTNFFERRVSAYQTAVTGEVVFHEDF